MTPRSNQNPLTARPAMTTGLSPGRLGAASGACCFGGDEVLRGGTATVIVPPEDAVAAGATVALDAGLEDDGRAGRCDVRRDLAIRGA